EHRLRDGDLASRLAQRPAEPGARQSARIWWPEIVEGEDERPGPGVGGDHRRLVAVRVDDVGAPLLPQRRERADLLQIPQRVKALTDRKVRALRAGRGGHALGSGEQRLNAQRGQEREELPE